MPENTGLLWVPKCFYPWAYPLATSLAFLRQNCVMYASCAGDMAFSCHPDTSFMVSWRQLIFLVQDKMRSWWPPHVHAAVIWSPLSITMCVVLSYTLQTEVFFCYQRPVMRPSLLILIFRKIYHDWVVLFCEGGGARCVWYDPVFDYYTPTNTPMYKTLKINTHLHVFSVKLCSKWMVSVSPSIL